MRDNKTRDWRTIIFCNKLTKSITKINTLFRSDYGPVFGQLRVHFHWRASETLGIFGKFSDLL